MTKKSIARNVEVMSDTSNLFTHNFRNNIMKQKTSFGESEVYPEKEATLRDKTYRRAGLWIWGIALVMALIALVLISIN